MRAFTNRPPPQKFKSGPRIESNWVIRRSSNDFDYSRATIVDKKFMPTPVAASSDPRIRRRASFVHARSAQGAVASALRTGTPDPPHRVVRGLESVGYAIGRP